MLIRFKGGEKYAGVEKTVPKTAYQRKCPNHNMALCKNMALCEIAYTDIEHSNTK